MLSPSLQFPAEHQHATTINVGNNRYAVTILHSPDGLEIQVYPMTDGLVWDCPFDTFYVREADIIALEQQM